MRRDSPLGRAYVYDRDDPIARLIVHYFYPCDFMHRDYHRVRRVLSRQKRRTKWRASQELCYSRLWLAMLYAVAEGFQKLGLCDPEIDLLLTDDALNRLRRLRNGTFHYQQHHEKLTQFFSAGRSNELWAEHLHAAFERFISDYTVDVAVKNLLAIPMSDANRAGEDSN